MQSVWAKNIVIYCDYNWKKLLRYLYYIGMMICVSRDDVLYLHDDRNLPEFPVAVLHYSVIINKKWLKKIFESNNLQKSGQC